MPMLQDIADKLVALGLADATSWPCFQSTMPPEPAQAIALFETSGHPPGTRQKLDRPGLQVRVRGAQAGYPAAAAKIKAIRLALHGFSGTIGATYYPWIKATGSPGSLGYDPNGRPELVCSFDVGESR